ncbi:MAG TPA: phosphatidate cytidylyltransferase, partial [Chloroflexia bacterium]|nr:phosphatidate cytidylyltransferase [Chloroflexia bacterium]
VGQGILLALGTATALSDVGAFVVGSRLGGPKLAPGISPNKTWAGAAGNLLGAYLGTGLLAFALPASWLLAVLPLIVAGGAIWGDLLESRIKREFGAKDAGNWLPGFGGLLDRVDSLILVGPLVFYFLHLTQLI